MSSVHNISTYFFTHVREPNVLRDAMKAEAQRHGLLGTILIAHEGINCFLAGTQAEVQAWVDWLHQDPRFASVDPKWSVSDRIPFKKLLVKVKPEIIRMNEPAIVPDFLEAKRAETVSTADLRRWLEQKHDDAGREVVLLDTRNAFEVGYGTFVGAIDPQIEKFSELPARVRDLMPVFEGKTVVTFCTGGIRCEKFALYMRALGHRDVYQLDGGILKYFENEGGAFYQGECFVFDEREALEPNLAPTHEPRRLPKKQSAHA